MAAVAALKGARLITADLMGDAAATLPPHYDFIYHFAAILGVQNVLDRPYETLRDNVALTAKAIELARRQTELKRFIFTSTSEIYAGTAEKFGAPIPTPATTPLALTDLDASRTSYMLSKICGESLCHYSGLPITILRPHNVYGPRMGMSHVIPQLLERAYKAVDGDVFPVYSVDHTRTFCFIDDAVEIAWRAAEAQSCIGKALNLGAQAPEVTIGTLADVVLSVVGRRLQVQPQPAHPGSPLRRCPDMSETSALIGFSAAVSLEGGVRRTFDWYKSHIFA